MQLMKNKTSKPQENPTCPRLGVWLLQVNHNLRVIFPFSVECISILQILDLSCTRIKCLPQSLYKLDQLRKFFGRGCELFLDMPSSSAILRGLKPQVYLLLLETGQTWDAWKCHFIGIITAREKISCQNCRIILQNVISNLLQLKKLSIDVKLSRAVNPYYEQWNVRMKDMVGVCSCPDVLLLNYLTAIWSA